MIALNHLVYNIQLYTMLNQDKNTNRMESMIIHITLYYKNKLDFIIFTKG